MADHHVPAARQAPRIALLLLDFGDGGVEHSLVNLARGLAGAGVQVDLISGASRQPDLDHLPAGVRSLALGPGRRRLQGLLAYLDERQPHILLSSKPDDDRIAERARRRTSAPTRWFLRVPTHLSGRLTGRRATPWRRWWKLRAARRLARRADGLIAVSGAVADDLAELTNICRSRIHTPRNPTIDPDLAPPASPPHPWLAGREPVILAIGGLRRQKDFATLLRAFALLRTQRPARLIVLGQGRQRARLLELARDLRIAERCDLPGRVSDTAAYLAHASLLASTSLWEGSPNVIIEAMALGTPVVATDCPGGTRELLGGGRYGRLAPMGDAQALAEAMGQTLAEPPRTQALQAGVEGYTIDASARQYLDAFGISPAEAAA